LLISSRHGLLATDNSVDVNENVYTRTSLDQRLLAVNALESSLKVT